MTRTKMFFSLQHARQLFELLSSLIFLALFIFPMVGYTLEKATQWEDISDKVEINKSATIKNRLGSGASVTVQLTNTSGRDLGGELRLIITDLDAPYIKVIKDLKRKTGLAEIINETGVTEAGELYYDLKPYVGDFLAKGAQSDLVKIEIEGGGSKHLTFNVRVEQKLLRVKITRPDTLITVGSTPLAVEGTINDPSAELTVNGVSVTQSGGSFSAQVALSEGHNTILARAVAVDGTEITDSISIALDTTPPYITIDSPLDGAVVKHNTIAVSGLVNDIVRGTVNAAQANVTVNNKIATVSNRSYLAEGITLSEGENTITVSASDEQGNTATKSITVNYQVPKAKHIEIVSGQNQSGKILTVLANPLKVKLINENGEPAANANVVYRVIQGDGIAGVGTDDEGQGVLTKTNADGIATTQFKLGSRSGKGNHKVRAKAVGFDSEVVFYASADTNPGNKVSINLGNNQRGAPNQSLPQPLIVAVTDEGANLVEGTQIEFKVTTGGGTFQNGETTYTATTDSDGRASASFILGDLVGLDVHRVSATIIGSNLTAGFTASALQPGDPGQTSITGVVLDNQDNPLPNITVRVDGSNRQAVTDAQGQFIITEAPVGSVHLIVDGSTTTVEGEWPTLSYNLVTIAGAENPLAAPVYMVKLDTENAVYVGKEDQVLTLKEVPGFKLEVKAGSITFPDGAKEGYLSVTPVNASKIPMAPPNGMQPQFIATIQPTGAVFDPPAPLTLPNVDGHAPGAQVEMYSFDHDLEEFVAIGLGTVSTDGSLIQTNVGVGVIKAGWHCGSQPGGSGCANSCAECKTCDGDCNCVNDDSQTPTSIKDRKGDCKKPGCEGGGAKQLPNDSDIPEGDIEGDCKKPGCEDGTEKDQYDDADILEEDAKCGSCFEGSIKPDSSKNDSKCGDGTERQNCFVCDEGKCGPPECPVDEGADQVFRLSKSAPGKIKEFADKVKTVLNKIPKIKVRKVTIEPRGEIVTGKRCCKDCRMDNPVSDFTRANIRGYVEIIGGAEYGPSIRFNKSLAYKGYGINAVIDAFAGVRLEISLTGNAGGVGEYLHDCIETEGCISLSGGANISIRPNGGIEINKVNANVLYAGKPKQVFDVRAIATIGFRVGQSGVQATLPIVGNQCPNLCQYTLGAISGDIKVALNISLLDFSILNPPDFTYVYIFWNGLNGSC